MEKLIVLGTGNAMATRCYNTCFALQNGDEYFLVDGGGGNGILGRTLEAGIPYEKIRHAFLTHSHTDHIFGMVWILRKISMLIGQDKYHGTFNFYCHTELLRKIMTIIELTMPHNMTRHFGKRIQLHSVADGETRTIMEHDITFFDIRSTKEKQFAFSILLHNNRKLTFLGDEPFRESSEQYAKNSQWLLSEAFCLYSQRDIFNPYAKHHSTVREACEAAERLAVQHLVLWHTEDSAIESRKQRYAAEGSQYFTGKLLIPDDLDVIPLQNEK